ncbi:rhamnan synthesis F family protein [Methylobacterium brachiatum]|uniref:rhamnan synthesis F family protein n=1 Tax=Methylobacterium brachiatum TaxID=269660 RepID=UPI00244CA8EE|nr:rhamnan synthesis F family protein [Methylobacterium brachiatum]MDH2310398.1 rhamnan synthesis F family protein [Methylobacterium brachiatum]
MTSDKNLLSLDREWYLLRYPDVADSGVDPSYHFDTYGKDEGRLPNSRAEEILSGDGFDRTWYKRFYKEVLSKDLDPAEHYLFIGRVENKFPNADAAHRASLLAVFDPIWYLARNHDVAKSGVKPSEHFLKYGYEEGRSPNERLEPRAKWRNWFDPSWYTARYPEVVRFGLSPLEHYLRIGVYENRAPHSGAEDKEEWATIVDEDWYANRYSDVTASGLRPLDHFIKYGIISHRRPNASVKYCGEPVEFASVDIILNTATSDNVVLFVTFTPTGKLRPHIIHHLKAFRNSAVSIFLIIATNSPSVEPDEEIYSLVDVILKRENKGFDFAAWAHIFRMYPDLFYKKSVILANDSTFGPFNESAFGEMLKSMYDTKSAIVGLTGNEEFGWHLQSYFLLLKQAALTSPAFQNFIAGVVSFKNKEEVIYEYETRFTQEMTKQGLHCEALYASIDSTNPTYYRWRDLIESGFPYVKISVFLGDAVRRGVCGWRDQLQERGYDTIAADSVLAENYAIGTTDKFLDFSRGLISQRNALYNLHQFFASKSRIVLHTSRMPKISVVIVAYNRAEHLLSLINDIGSFQRFGEIELIIIDNGSSDETAHLCSLLSNASIITYSSPKNAVTILRDVAVKARTSTFLLLRDIIYFNTEVIDTAISTFSSLDSRKLITGSISDINNYAPSPYPSFSELRTERFINPDYSVFENTSGDAFDYISIFSRTCLERCVLTDGEPAGDLQSRSFLGDILTAADIEIEFDHRLGIVLV